ncbi:unnamed protein product [Rotaria sp. Silwood2]|nr:unnamed protein product [Rotaria sp. Silwood2]CAF4721868.1 unnamed protein product [Rotaria sp. Silwood2]
MIKDLLQVTPNISQLTMDFNIDQICKIFPKLEYISLYAEQRDDILEIFNRLHYLISANIRWKYPFNTHPSIIDKYLQENNICTDGTYSFQTSSLEVWID